MSTAEIPGVDRIGLSRDGNLYIKENFTNLARLEAKCRVLRASAEHWGPGVYGRFITKAGIDHLIDSQALTLKDLQK